MKKIKIGYLYPEYMNIYGDTGNIVTLIKRGKSREIEIDVVAISKDSSHHSHLVDMYFFGGGQDQQQIFVSKDLQKHKNAINEDLHNGVVALAICGGYQLLGKFYRPFNGDDLPGIGFLPIETHASNTRMINNLVIKTSMSLNDAIMSIYESNTTTPKTLVGFENHSGQTTVPVECEVLGSTVYGYGNNESKQAEGCQVKNVFGTYMHGSFLPKNPHFADYLLALALHNKYQEEVKFSPLDDEYAYKAHAYIVNKYASYDNEKKN